MAYDVKLARIAKKYLKKLKEKPLKEIFLDSIYDEIAVHPEEGHPKTGDLLGYYTYNFKYKGTQYRIAYTVNDRNQIVIVVLTGSHEGFYKELKRIIKSMQKG